MSRFHNSCIFRIFVCIAILLVAMDLADRNQEYEESRETYTSLNIPESRSRGSISRYDDLVKKYSDEIGLDWRFLSAIIWYESGFSMDVRSPFGAVGLMQIKQSTAAAYGIDDIYNPDGNLSAGTKHLKRLMRMYEREGIDSLNVLKFTLAAYNCGENRLQQYRDRALEKGADPNDWEAVRSTFDFPEGKIPLYIDDILCKWEDYVQRGY